MKCHVWCILLFIVLLSLSLWTAESRAAELQILTEEWPPVSFSNNGKPDGLGVEIVREILKRVNMPDTIKIYPWARAWSMVISEPNIVLFTVTRTEEREKLLTMIGPVAIGTTNFYAKKGSGITINSLEDARKMERVGVYHSAVEEQILTKEQFTNLDVTTLPLQSAKKLMLGRIDLWCNANLTAGGILKDAGYSIDDVENVYTVMENHLYIAISKGTSEDVVNQWKDALEAMKKDGTFARIYNKWLPGEQAPEQTERIGVLQ